MISLLGALALLATEAQADDKLDCFSPTTATPARAIACGAVANDSALPATMRADALIARAAISDGTQALRDYDAALRLVPDDVPALVARGKLREAANDLTGAEADYSAALAKQPALGEALARRGALRIKQGKTEAGLADLGDARRYAPNDPVPFRIRGRMLLDQGKIAEARAELAQAIALDPGDAESTTLLGTADLRGNQSAEAIAAFSAVLARDPTHVEALRGRATAYGRQENFAAAIADLDALLKRAPNDVPALKARGVARLQSGGPAEAIPDFTRLLESTDDIEARFFRATAYFRNRQPHEAESDFSAVLTQAPGEPDALSGRGLARLMQGELAAAEADFTAALAAKPGAGDILGNRGQLRLLRGDFAGADADLGLALNTDAANLTLALWRSITGLRAGREARVVRAELDTVSRRLGRSTWPSPVVAHSLGALSDAELLVAARQGEADADLRLSETYFYLGEEALIRGAKPEAERMFRQALTRGVHGSFADIGAQIELAKLGARVAPDSGNRFPDNATRQP